MHSYGFDDYSFIRANAARWRAWKLHYMAKGCNEHKAFWLAQKKTHTWPPEISK